MIENQTEKNDNLKVHFSSMSNEWETPRELFNSLNKEFAFEIDVSATKENALCNIFFTKDDDALSQDWSKYKVAWCNPPYGRLIGKFVKKGYEESLKGCTVVFLIPARVDTRWWHDYCAKGEVRFCKGRLKFQNRSLPSWREDGNFKASPAPFPSAIVVMKKDIVPQTSYIDFKSISNV
jgi:phage N-6-adenine-methyltransferase